MKKLIITEKLSVACKIGAAGRKYLGDFKLSDGTVLTSNYLNKNEKKVQGIVSRVGKLENKDYIIMYAAGHLVELYQAYDYDATYRNWRNIPYPFIPNPFKTKVIKGQEKLFNSLKEAMNSPNVSEIICATDADREGENIFALIYNQAHCNKPVKRLWTDSHAEKQLLKAFKEMKNEKYYESLRTAGYCRMVSDWLLGAVLTAKATIELSSGKDIVSVGRVQTAVLAEIVDREDLVKNFKSKKFYNIIAKFKTKNGKVYEGIYEEDFNDINKANNFINKMNNKGKITLYNKTKKNNYCPLLFDQTGLQIAMSRVYGISPDKTLEASQGLYEKGYATYPRTASRYITSADADDFKNMLYEIRKINPLVAKVSFNKNNKRIIDDKKVESHIAIIPTVEIPDINKLSQNEKTVYDALVKRVIAINFPPAIDEKQEIQTEVSGYMFKSTGIKELQKGWREVYNINKKDNDLPIVNVGDIVEIVSIEAKEVITQPPKRYTEATILNFMETCGKKIEDEEMRELIKNKGIGTIATRADIISKLKKTKYIEIKGKTIYPTKKGNDVIKKFPIDELKNAEFTGQMEYELYKVEKGESTKQDYINRVIDLYEKSCSKLDGKKIGQINSNSNLGVGKCPLCGGKIVKKKGKYGAFYSCNNYKDGCKFTIGKICGKLLTQNQVKTLLEKGKTNKVKGLKKKDGTELPPAIFILQKDGTIKLDFR